MKIVAKAIEVVAWFQKEGLIRPVRFRVEGEDGFKVIKIDQIIQMEEEKYAGNRMILFRCQSTIDGIERMYEIKYEIETCQWMLYKFQVEKSIVCLWYGSV